MRKNPDCRLRLLWSQIFTDSAACSLPLHSIKFKQDVNCPTRLKNNNKTTTNKQTTFDLCYCNISDAYKSVSLPPLGTSDHSTIHLTPTYRPKIQTEQVVKKHVKVWSSDSVEQLQDCSDCTDWDMFLDTCDNIHDASDVISDCRGAEWGCEGSRLEAWMKNHKSEVAIT